MDKKDLKIQALLERMSSDKAKYEDEIANLRVEFTAKSQEYEASQNEVNELRAQLDTNNTPEEVVQGEVVEYVEEEEG